MQEQAAFEHASLEWQRPAEPAAMPIPIDVHPANRTPVFSTAEPNPGLAARLRRLAYSHPSHKTQRWLLLLAADRVESAGLVGRELLIPGRQPMAVRHYARQARANPTGFAIAGLALAGLFLLSRRGGR